MGETRLAYGELMGDLIDQLMQTCEVCKTTALPLSISGKYTTGSAVVMHEWPNCGYIRKHGGLGPIAERASLSNIRKRLKKSGHGQMSLLLLRHAQDTIINQRTH